MFSFQFLEPAKYCVAKYHALLMKYSLWKGKIEAFNIQKQIPFRRVQCEEQVVFYL